MIQGILFDIQKNTIHDGPGLRTTVFFKGCDLRCKWCHNPESWLMEPQNMVVNHKEIDCGKSYTVEQVMTQLLKDKVFYDKSGGGVTFSGGECMLQLPFLKALLIACKEEGISTAIDTAGHFSYDDFVSIMDYTDLFLYDIKCITSSLHKEYVGAENDTILDNYRKLIKGGCSVWVRIPVVPSFNANMEEMGKIQAFLSEYPPQRVDLLPYHRLGIDKSTALGYGKTWETQPPSEAELTSYRDGFKESII